MSSGTPFVVNGPIRMRFTPHTAPAHYGSSREGICPSCSVPLVREDEYGRCPECSGCWSAEGDTVSVHMVVESFDFDGTLHLTPPA